MKTIQPKLAILAVLLGGCCGATSSAEAGGFLNTVQSANGAGAAAAGDTALGEDAATVWYNPAGMVLLPRPEVLSAGGLSFPSTSFENRGSTDAAGLPSGGNTRIKPPVSLLPSLFGSFPLSEQLHLGVSLLVPFGQETRYDDGWVGRYQIQQAALKTIDIRPAVAYRINSWISMGAGLDVQYADFKTANAIDFGTLCLATGGCVAAPESADGRLVTRLISWGVGYDFGVLLELSPDLRVGANYKSRIDGSFAGDAQFKVPPVAAPLTEAGAFTNTSASAALNFPQVVSLGVVWRVDERWTALVDTSWTQWSAEQQLSAVFGNPTPPIVEPLHWHDSWRVAAGGIYHLSEGTDLRGGVAFDQSPIGDQFRSADLPQADALDFAVGLRHRVTDNLELAWSYDYERVMNASLNLTQPGAGTLSGTARQQAHSLGMQARWQF
jgi:long-chain fatty acid transport protein